MLSTKYWFCSKEAKKETPIRHINTVELVVHDDAWVVSKVSIEGGENSKVQGPLTLVSYLTKKTRRILVRMQPTEPRKLTQCCTS